MSNTARLASKRSKSVASSLIRSLDRAVGLVRWLRFCEALLFFPLAWKTALPAFIGALLNVKSRRLRRRAAVLFSGSVMRPWLPAVENLGTGLEVWGL